MIVSTLKQTPSNHINNTETQMPHLPQNQFDWYSLESTKENNWENKSKWLFLQTNPLYMMNNA